MWWGALFVLGAGASVDSGLRTYRGKDGLYAKLPDGYEATVLNVKTAYANPGAVYDALEELHAAAAKAKPGPTYQKLREFSARVGQAGILTQNVDGLALQTGVETIELHGRIRTHSCMTCNASEPIDFKNQVCPCGGKRRPDVTLFGESLRSSAINNAYLMVKNLRGLTSIAVIIGTSMQFPYLRTLLSKFKQRGGKVVHINPDPDYHMHVRPGERWIKSTAADGIDLLISEIPVPSVPAPAATDIPANTSAPSGSITHEKASSTSSSMSDAKFPSPTVQTGSDPQNAPVTSALQTDSQNATVTCALQTGADSQNALVTSANTMFESAGLTMLGAETLPKAASTAS